MLNILKRIVAMLLICLMGESSLAFAPSSHYSFGGRPPTTQRRAKESIACPCSQTVFFQDQALINRLAMAFRDYQDRTVAAPLARSVSLAVLHAGVASWILQGVASLVDPTLQLAAGHALVLMLIGSGAVSLWVANGLHLKFSVISANVESGPKAGERQGQTVQDFVAGLRTQFMDGSEGRESETPFPWNLLGPTGLEGSLARLHEAMERKDYPAAAREIDQAVDFFMKFLRTIPGNERAVKISKADLIQWSRRIGAPGIFNENELKNLEFKIHDEKELRQVLTTALRMGVDYYREAGPDISGQAPRLYGVIADPASLRAEDFERPVPIRVGRFGVTASNASVTEHRLSKDSYILKWLHSKTAMELLGQQWFRLLGFSTVDTQIVDFHGTPAVVMRKLDHVVTLENYLMSQLVHPELLFPAGSDCRTLVPRELSSVIGIFQAGRRGG